MAKSKAEKKRDRSAQPPQKKDVNENKKQRKESVEDSSDEVDNIAVEPTAATTTTTTSNAINTSLLNWKQKLAQISERCVKVVSSVNNNEENASNENNSNNAEDTRTISMTPIVVKDKPTINLRVDYKVFIPQLQKILTRIAGDVERIYYDSGLNRVIVDLSRPEHVNKALSYSGAEFMLQKQGFDFDQQFEITRIERDENLDERTVFVDGVPVWVTERMLRDLFSEFGVVLNVSIILNKTRLQATIEYRTQDEAQDAVIAMHDGTIEGKHCYVKLRSEMKGGRTGATIYVGNLPFTVSEEVLRSYFVEVGRIKQISLHKGFAFITFFNGKDAMTAMEFNGADIEGRPCKISMATEKQSKTTARPPPYQQRA